MSNKYIVKGKKLPNQNIFDVFVEFCRLESAINGAEYQKNYVVMRLVTIIEQFCRNIVRYKLAEHSHEFSGKIELEIPLIGELINTASKRTHEITKEEIISASHQFQNTEAISSIMQRYKINAFRGLNRKEYDEFFDLRHELVHTVKKLPSFEAQKYYDLIEKLMKNIMEQDTNIQYFYDLKISALQKLKKHNRIKECYNEAKEYFEKAINRKPTDADAYDGWGVVLQSLGRYHEAINCFDAQIKLNPNDDEAYFMKGMALQKLEDRRGTMECLDKIIEINPNDASGYYNKGLSLQDFGDHSEAIKCFNKTIELDHNNSDAYCAKGESLQELGDHKEAVECFERCIKIHPTTDFVHVTMGASLQKLGESGRARECFVKELIYLTYMKSMHPTHVNYYAGISWQGLERHSMAIECFDKTLTMDPKHIDALLGRGKSLLNNKRNAEAEECFNEILKQEPENKEAQNGKKTAFEKLGKHC